MAHLTMLSTRIPKLKTSIPEKLCFTSRFSTCYHLPHSTCFSLSSHHQSNSNNKITKHKNNKFIITNKSNANLNPTAMSAAASSTLSTDENMDTSYESEAEVVDEKFDWYAQWYPVMPLCDLDKRKPTGKRVIGIDIVAWWDRTESQWKVFNDMCPHRLAPLSEGRIDQQGRLQCVYHGWCFNGSGHCKLIPQAPSDGPPVHTSKKACVTVYPSTVQNNIVWFWPNPDPEFKDILDKKKPPFLPHLDDPSYSNLFTTRDMNYGYEVLIENLMDPSHLPYAHYGVVKTPPPIIKVDREGGSPLNLGIKHMNINGFSTMDSGHFFAPCVFYFYHPVPPSDDGNGNGNGNGSVSASETGANKVPSSQLKHVLMFICVPVSPGKSRLLWSAPRNFGVWMDKIIPRWVFHLHQNLIIDSDLYILHVQEQKVMEYGPRNWQKNLFRANKGGWYSQRIQKVVE